MDADVVIKVPSSYETLAILRTAVRSYLEVESIDETVRFQLVSVIDELATNTVEHAYPEGNPKRENMVISLKKRDNTMFFYVEDFGAGFNKDKQSKEEGGMGLYIAKGLVDELKVVKKEIGTKIEVYKRLKEEGNKDDN